MKTYPYPQLTDPIDKTGLTLSVPCVAEFYRAGKNAAITALFKFDRESDYLLWSHDDRQRLCKVAADRNIAMMIFTAPNMPNEGYERFWNTHSEIEYAAF
jgi:hypothetical protein